MIFCFIFRGDGGKSPFNKAPSEKPEGCTTVFVGNLSWNADENMLREAFAECGNVIDVRISKDRETGQSKGYVNFYL